MPEKLKISFLIDSLAVGAFLHQYADKVQGLEIVALHGVAWHKNKPRDEKPPHKMKNADRTAAIARFQVARDKMLEAMKKGPLTSAEISKLPGMVEKRQLWGLINRMRTQDRTIVRNGLGEYQLAPKSSRPPGGYNFERPEIRKKATKKAVKAMKKKGIDFADLARKSNEAKRLKKLQAQKLNGAAARAVPKDFTIGKGAEAKAKVGDVTNG